jgi:hypothetical protein
MASVENKGQFYRTSAGNAVDFLALLFEDDDIDDSGSGNELQKRLNTILRASADPGQPGVTHFSGIFSNLKDRGFRPEFKDPWPSSANQCGHFTTAVHMGFDPLRTGRYVYDSVKSLAPRVAGILPAFPPLTFPLAENLCARLIVGHEQSTDAGVDYLVHYRQFLAATDSEIRTFLDAVAALPNDLKIDISKASSLISSIRIGTGEGNSKQDLLLSLYGYKFGSRVRLGNLTTRADAGKWLRGNLEAPGIPVPLSTPSNTAAA